jgi:hypothetical protein
MIPILLIVGVVIYFMTKDKAKTYVLDSVTESRYEGVKYFLIEACNRYSVPYWIMNRIALIETGFQFDKRGATDDWGLVQITPPALADFNNQNPNYDFYTIEQMLEPLPCARVGTWLIKKHLTYYQGNVEKAVRAYNGGRGNINSNATFQYWRRFQDAGRFFPEEG